MVIGCWLSIGPSVQEFRMELKVNKTIIIIIPLKLVG